MSLDVNSMVQQNSMENSECILCGSCVDNCPKGAVKYSFNRKSQVSEHRMSLNVKEPDKTGVILALCGIMGPIVYALVTGILGLLWAEYNPISIGMSELGAVGAPHATFMNTFGFQLLGVLMAAFGFGLHRSLRNGWLSKIGAALIVIGGIDMIAVGFFPMDPAGLPSSLTNVGHDITATLASNAIIIGMIVTSLSFRKDNQWRCYWLFTLGFAIASLALSPFPMLPIYNPYAGLIQRLAMGFSLLWIEVISIKLLSLARGSDSRPQQPKM